MTATMTATMTVAVGHDDGHEGYVTFVLILIQAEILIARPGYSYNQCTIIYQSSAYHRNVISMC